MATDDGVGSRMAFQGEPVFPSPRGGGGRDGDQPAARKTRSGGGGFDALDGDRLFSVDPHDAPPFFREQHHRQPDLRWGAAKNGGSTSGGEDEEEDVDDDGEEDEDGLVSLEEGNNNSKANNNSSGSAQSCSEKINDERATNLRELNSPFGLGRRFLTKDLNGGRRGNLGEQQYQTSQMAGYPCAVTVAESGPYYGHSIHSGDGLSTPMQQELRAENGCASSGRREVGLSGGYWETLRTHLSDPITDILMDDAMILSCGHSYGSGGIQHVYKMRACFRCGQPITENSVRPNLALRAAVQAFCREEEPQSLKTLKRRRDRLEQERCNHGDAYPIDFSRGKGAQFPFAVSDRVMIKGNKRTPQRFVGRVAVVTAQCLNGWYVVKTLDKAESVKLQYRSLEKITENQSPKQIANNSQTPNWL